MCEVSQKAENEGTGEGLEGRAVIDRKVKKFHTIKIFLFVPYLSPAGPLPVPYKFPGIPRLEPAWMLGLGFIPCVPYVFACFLP